MKTLIYCGPDIPQIPLTENQAMLIKREIPDNVKRAVEKWPELKGLFVKAEDFAEFKTRKNKVGTREHQIYEQAKQYKGVI